MRGYERMTGKPDRQLDNTPVEMPFGSCRPTPLQDLIARMVREAVQAEKGDEFETFEESNDFEEEDPDTLDLSRYELQELPRELVEDFSIEEDDPDPAPETGDPPDQNEEEPDKP